MNIVSITLVDKIQYVAIVVVSMLAYISFTAVSKYSFEEVQAEVYLYITCFYGNTFIYCIS